MSVFPKMLSYESSPTTIESIDVAATGNIVIGVDSEENSTNLKVVMTYNPDTDSYGWNHKFPDVGDAPVNVHFAASDTRVLVNWSFKDDNS